MDGMVLLEALNNDGSKSGRYDYFEKDSAEKMTRMKNAKWVTVEKKATSAKKKRSVPERD